MIDCKIRLLEQYIFKCLEFIYINITRTSMRVKSDFTDHIEEKKKKK